MKHRYEIVPATALHARSVARRMRQADRDEVFAASGKTPFEALKLSMRKSTYPKAWLVDGRPEVLFGVTDLNILAGIGAPWALGTDEIERHQRAFLSYSLDWLRQLSRRYAVLRNFADCRNTTSVRWLKWLGFEFAEPFDWRGHPFSMFEMRLADVRFDDGPYDRFHSDGCRWSNAAGESNVCREQVQCPSPRDERDAGGAPGERRD